MVWYLSVCVMCMCVCKVKRATVALLFASDCSCWCASAWLESGYMSYPYVHLLPACICVCVLFLCVIKAAADRRVD